MHIEVEKPKINPAHFIAIVGGAALTIAIQAFALGVVWTNLNNSIGDQKDAIDLVTRRFETWQAEIDRQRAKDEADRKDRLKTYQSSLDNLNAGVAQISPLQFQQSRMLEQIAENKSGIIETGKRIDRVVDSFGGKVDTLIDGVNKLTTRVEVLGSKFDDSQARKTDYRIQPPVIRR